VHRAVAAAERLRRAGIVPVVPHLAVLWEMIAPGADYEGWMALDLALLERCDALVRLPGASAGADREVAHARARRIPVLEGDAAAILVAAAGRPDRRWVGDSKSVGATANPQPADLSPEFAELTDRPSRRCDRRSRSPSAAIDRGRFGSATYAASVGGPDRALPLGVNTAPLIALKIDADDLSAALHLVGDGAGQRGDDDTHRALRLLARHAEAMGEALERILRAESAEKETRCPQP
jgi:hypothetical protein